ncbi:hypothetical protein [Streptomyces cahuitamycinicus]|nr:hypothetical protein [Streptomyces cahuitamycinicus]
MSAVNRMSGRSLTETPTGSDDRRRMVLRLAALGWRDVGDNLGLIRMAAR